MFKRFAILASLGFACSYAGQARAARLVDQPRRERSGFDRLDANGDGKIDRDEFARAGKRRWAAEARRPGRSVDESAGPWRHGRAFRQQGSPARRNRQGASERSFRGRGRQFEGTGEEGICPRCGSKAGAERRFRSDEKREMRRSQMQRSRRFEEPTGRRQGRPSKMRRQKGDADERRERRGERILRRHDLNEDGIISRDEFRGPAERFEQLDRNADGRVDPKELEKAQRRGRGQGSPRSQR